MKKEFDLYEHLKKGVEVIEKLQCYLKTLEKELIEQRKLIPYKYKNGASELDHKLAMLHANYHEAAVYRSKSLFKMVGIEEDWRRERAENEGYKAIDITYPAVPSCKDIARDLKKEGFKHVDPDSVCHIKLSEYNYGLFIKPENTKRYI